MNSKDLYGGAEFVFSRPASPGSGAGQALLGLVEKMLMHLFEQLVIAAIIYSNPNQNRSRDFYEIQCCFRRSATEGHWPT
jgi:hypothetical protein